MGDLETLWDRLISLFDVSNKFYSSIEIALPSETLKFDNVDELKSYSQLNGSITNFSLWLSQDDKHIHIRPGSFLNESPEISVRADNEAWCAGAIETTYSFLHSNKIWYNWFVSAPIGWLLLIFANIPNFAGLLLPKEQSIGKWAIIAWLLILVTLAILYFARSKLLPSSILIVTKKENFIRRNAAELSLVVAVTSAILTVVGWFFSK